MSNIVKASELAGPVISGKVSVELLELDKMRSDHAKAVALAKELENNQAKVLVVYSEQGSYNSRKGGYDQRELSRQYVHFEDFRAIIAAEEEKKVQKKVEDLINEKDQYRISYLNTKRDLGVLEGDMKVLTTKHDTLQEDHGKLNTAFNEASESIERQAIEINEKAALIVEQQAVINKLLTTNKNLEFKKSFWGFLS